MMGVMAVVLIIAVFYFGSSVTYGQSVAPYSSCIVFDDNGYNVIVQQDNDCNAQQFMESLFYYEANGYHRIDYENSHGTQQVHLMR
jgi:hypothetical protein